MRTLNTTLTHPDRDEPITIQLDPAKGFNDLFSAGFVLRSQDPFTRQFATDAKGLRNVKDGLEDAQSECLWGLSGIGALLLAADPANLTRGDLENVGALIKNLSKLAVETQCYIDSINNDLADRANLIDNPEQAAHHAEIHREAVAIRRKQSMSYADAVVMAADRLSMRLADEAASREV